MERCDATRAFPHRRDVIVPPGAPAAVFPRRGCAKSPGRELRTPRSCAHERVPVSVERCATAGGSRSPGRACATAVRGARWRRSAVPVRRPPASRWAGRWWGDRTGSRSTRRSRLRLDRPDSSCARGDAGSNAGVRRAFGASDGTPPNAGGGRRPGLGRSPRAGFGRHRSRASHRVAAAPDPGDAGHREVCLPTSS